MPNSITILCQKLHITSKFIGHLGLGVPFLDLISSLHLLLVQSSPPDFDGIFLLKAVQDQEEFLFQLFLPLMMCCLPKRLPQTSWGSSAICHEAGHNLLDSRRTWGCCSRVRLRIFLNPLHNMKFEVFQSLCMLKFYSRSPVNFPLAL